MVVVSVLESYMPVSRSLDILNSSILRNWLAVPGVVGVGEVRVGESKLKLLSLSAIVLS